MSKTLVIDAEEKTRIPFLRGILTRSLQDIGLDFEDAYELAAQVRDEVSGQAEIESDELRKIVTERLRKTRGDHVADHYAARTRTSDDVMILSASGQSTPFSPEVHRKSLEFCGMNDEQARALSRTLGQHLANRRRKEVSSSYLGRLTYRLLSKDIGKRAAQHYLVWRDFAKSGIPLLLLIGGAPGCGKSTIATALASRLDIFKTQSTDILREVMRMMIPERLLPVLHCSSFEAWRTLPESDLLTDKEERIANGYRHQSDLLSVSCEAVVQRAVHERVSMVLEGVHIDPTVVNRLRVDDGVIVVPVMLAVPKQESLRQRFRGRGGTAPQRRAKRYLDHFESIWHLQSYLLAEADKAQMPIAVNDDREATVTEILCIIIDILEKELKSTLKTVFPVNG